MSIFDIDPFEKNIYDEEYIKDEIIKYLSSNESVYDIYNINGFNSNSPMDSLSIKELTNLFFEKFQIPIQINDINKLSIYELIEIFINISKNINNLIHFYKTKKQNQNEEIGYGIILEINPLLKNIIKSYLKLQKITFIEKENNKFILDFSKSIGIEQIKNKSLKIALSDYKKMKLSEINEENIERKINIISSLKNNLDSFFQGKYKVDNSFIEIKSNCLKSFWQAIGSHRGKDQVKDNKYAEVQQDFSNQDLVKQNKKLDDCINAIFWIIINNGL